MVHGPTYSDWCYVNGFPFDWYIGSGKNLLNGCWNFGTDTIARNQCHLFQIRRKCTWRGRCDCWGSFWGDICLNWNKWMQHRIRISVVRGVWINSCTTVVPKVLASWWLNEVMLIFNCIQGNSRMTIFKDSPLSYFQNKFSRKFIRFHLQFHLSAMISTMRKYYGYVTPHWISYAVIWICKTIRVFLSREFAHENLDFRWNTKLNFQNVLFLWFLNLL